MKLVELFTSINGEGKEAGKLAVFIRFPGCNLHCSYCDTMWANKADVEVKEYTLEEILTYVKASGAKQVTVTGGEPLLQKDCNDLFKGLHSIDVNIEIETNGSVPLGKTIKQNPYVTFTMDYKMPSSKMEEHMEHNNFQLLRPQDTLKMVCGSELDLLKVLEILPQIDRSVSVFLSPVFGRIDPARMVEFMMEHKLVDVKLQLQLHKFIWDPNQTGV